MEFKPFFSIITPTYNRAFCLWRAVQSVLNQTYPFFELIIVDDGSTDDTEKLVSIFSDPRIKYIKMAKNSGPSVARNIGLKKSSGKYIAYLDSDNAWYPEFLEVMNKAAINNKEKVLFFSKKNYRLILVDEKGGRNSVRDEFSNSEKYFDLKRLWHRRIMIDTNIMCHKRNEIMELGGWDESLGFWEDWELSLRLSNEYPNGFLFINRVMLDYEQNIDLKEADKVFKFWEIEEEKIFKKHKNNPLLEGQTWFPPGEGNKSTLGVVEYLKNKHKVKKTKR